MINKSTPIIANFKSAQKGGNPTQRIGLVTFDSYQFTRSVLTPASSFRFTAPGVDISTRTSIRSGDWIELFVTDPKGNSIQIATGIVDETDTHVMPTKVEYVITGRDTVGQLIDNASVDAQNNNVYMTPTNITAIAQFLLKNTRLLYTNIIAQQVPSGNILFQTNPGETKMGALQRSLDLANVLIWTAPNGQIIIGKPNMSQKPTPNAKFILDPANPSFNNCLEARVKRAPNLAIRQMVVQLQTQATIPAAGYTVINNDKDMLAIQNNIAGRSVFDTFTYGDGADAADQLTFVGNQSGNIKTLGANKAKREIAKENMKVIDVEVVVQDHINGDGRPFNVDQVYEVIIPDDLVSEVMYVYEVSYDLTLEHGRTTTLKLCRLGAIVADIPITGSTG